MTAPGGHDADRAARERLAEEARATASALLDWVGTRVEGAAAARSSAARNEGPSARPRQSPGPCTWCPVCALVAALRGEQPELTAALAEQASGLLVLLRLLVAAHATGAHDGGSARPAPGAHPGPGGPGTGPAAHPAAGAPAEDAGPEVPWDAGPEVPWDAGPEVPWDVAPHAVFDPAPGSPGAATGADGLTGAAGSDRAGGAEAPTGADAPTGPIGPIGPAARPPVPDEHDGPARTTAERPTGKRGPRPSPRRGPVAAPGADPGAATASAPRPAAAAAPSERSSRVQRIPVRRRPRPC